MRNSPHISVGQYSDKGRKPTNQDFHGILVPDEPLLALKGIAVVLCDGISSSNVSHIASEMAVKSMLTDYYGTSQSWSVKNSVHRVLEATNSWLHAMTRNSHARYDADKGYVCTISAMVIKSTTAHLFHIGDSRVYRVAGASLEQLTADHRVQVSAEQSYLGRALGVNSHVEIDYQALRIDRGDVFLLMTDGIWEHVAPRAMVETINDHAGELDCAAEAIAKAAFAAGSLDNLTIQIIRIDDVSAADAGEAFGQTIDLPPPPLLQARTEFDGYRIIRDLHASSRSHLYLAEDIASGTRVAIKIPSVDMRADPAYLKRFMMEEWVAHRLDSPHVMRPGLQARKRNYVYVVTEFIDGQTLAQWMIDNPHPDLETVRGIIEQVAKGLRAFHRKEMVHQDLRPANIMIDKFGTVKIIDFGATRIAGIAESAPDGEQRDIPGTLQYTAPEYFLGEGGSSRSDIFSLGVITYQMLTGELPFGSQIATAKGRVQLGKLVYKPAMARNPRVPSWIDGALKAATQPYYSKRYETLSEYLFDLRQPNLKYLSTPHTPLIERNPLLFWKVLALALACAIVFLLAH